MSDQDSGGNSPKMVYICCVKGCRNNSFSSSVILHEFPKDKEMNNKWLNAIGCPNWTPPECYRICNEHFDYDQIDHENNGIKLKDNAIPSYRSFNIERYKNPEYVEKKIINFKASDVEACRICLATDVKMYNINDTKLNDYMDLIIGLNNPFEGLPKYVCYQCAPDLKRCEKLIAKSQTSQAIFQDIFSKCGEVTLNLIKAQNRQKLNLESSLDNFLLINYYHVQYDDGTAGIDPTVTVKNDLDQNMDIAVINDSKHELSENGELLTNKIEEIYDTKTVQSDDEKAQEINMEIIEAKVSNVEKPDENLIMNNTKEINTDDKLKMKSLKEKSKPRLNFKWKKKGKGKKFHQILFPDNMVKHFNIIEIPAKEQLLEWQKSSLDSHKPDEEILKCEVCGKEFTDGDVYRAHVHGHETVLGSYKCKACQKHLSKFRAIHLHSKRYYCKFCSKTFNNMDNANNHTALGKCMGRNDFKPTFIVPEEPNHL